MSSLSVPSANRSYKIGVGGGGMLEGPEKGEERMYSIFYRRRCCPPPPPRPLTTPSRPKGIYDDNILI